MTELAADAAAAGDPAAHELNDANGEGTSVVSRSDQAVAGEAVDVASLLERGRTLCTPVLREAVARLAPPMDKVSAYHFGWTDAEGRPTAGDGGKAVRPALALLSATAAGVPAQVGVPGGVAVELVHNFSLLHDDLMDGDEQRRHRATVWTVFGPAQAILVGDALMALATEVLLEAGDRGATSPVDAGRAVRRLTTATRKLIDGQAQDLSFEHRDTVTVEECLEMEGNKTGALLAASSSIGAVLAGMDDTAADALERYGHHLGLAFQAVDGGHRQAALGRPAPAQEVAARRRRARRGRPRLPPPRRAAGRRGQPRPRGRGTTRGPGSADHRGRGTRLDPGRGPPPAQGGPRRAGRGADAGRSARELRRARRIRRGTGEVTA
jgi:hypothetical protein